MHSAQKQGLELQPRLVSRARPSAWARAWQAVAAVVAPSRYAEVRAVAVKRRGSVPVEAPPRYFLADTFQVADGKGGLRLRQLERLVIRADASAIVVGEGISNVALRELGRLSERLGCALVYPAPGSPVHDGRPNLVWAGDQPFFELGARPIGGRQPLSKRALDVVAGCVGLVLLAPLLVLIALGIRVDSQGPIFFAQARAGWHGRRFRMYKFRTMRQGSDEEKIDLEHLNASGDRRLFKIPNDPRVTTFGRFLRRWSLDELPQLWNVLCGDMSLVGPRPFFESDLQDYEAHHFRRLTVKPGITGNWQVQGRSDILDFEEVVRLDREYIERWSFGLDAWILAQTVPAVLRRSGAY
jgi:lipopolysaccharide/colanic/teichoic acid biosynthesis glycosyltransferase